MVESSIFKYVQQNIIGVYICNIYMHNLGYVEVLSENAINNVSTIVCIPYLFIYYKINK